MKTMVLAVLIAAFPSNILKVHKYKYIGTPIKSLDRLYPAVTRFKYRRVEELFNKYVDRRASFREYFKGFEILWEKSYRNTTNAWEIEDKVITAYVPLSGNICDFPLEYAFMEYALLQNHKYVSQSRYRKLRKAVKGIKKECK